MNLVSTLRSKTEEIGEKEILLDEGKWWRLRDITTAAAGLSAVLNNKNAGPEGNIGLLLPNSAGFVIGYWGILRILSERCQS